MRPRLERYLETIKGYETNRYEITPELRARIDRRWGEVIRRYGYECADVVVDVNLHASMGYETGLF